MAIFSSKSQFLFSNTEVTFSWVLQKIGIITLGRKQRGLKWQLFKIVQYREPRYRICVRPQTMLLPPLPPVNFRNESHVEPIPFQGLVEIMVFLGFKNSGSYIVTVCSPTKQLPYFRKFSLKTVITEYVHFSRQIILALLAIIFYSVSFPDCASESGSKVA